MLSETKQKDRIKVLLSDLRRFATAKGSAVSIQLSPEYGVSIEGNRDGLYRLGIDLAWWVHHHTPTEDPDAYLVWPIGEFSYVDCPPKFCVVVQETISKELSGFAHTAEKYRRQSKLMEVVLIWLPLLFWLGVGIAGISYLTSWIVRLFA